MLLVDSSHKEGDAMKEIPLTKGMTAIVDDEDHHFLSQWKWRYDNGYARRRNKTADGIWKDIHMHRLLAKTPEHLVCDHINGDTLDNRKSNLRNVTIAENVRNRQNARGQSKHVGVHPRCDGKKWVAQITRNYKCQHLGSFDTEEEAQIAYMKARHQDG
jgi:hypothetical protein